MVIFLGFLIAFIVAFFTLNIKVNIKKLQIKTYKNIGLKEVKYVIDNLYFMKNVNLKVIYNFIIKKIIIVKYEVYIVIRIFKIVPIFIVKITNNTIKVNNIKISKEKLKISKFYKKMPKEKNIDFVKIIPKVEKIKIFNEFSTKNKMLNVWIIFILNIFYVFIFKMISLNNDNLKKWDYIIKENKINENQFNIVLECIIIWNFTNIICIFNLFRKRGLNYYGKSSNRRSDEKCYG